MTVDKLKAYEPIFGAWTVEGKIAEGRFSKVFKVSKALDGQAEYQCLKTIRFPANDEELSKVISSGIYENVQQYLDEVELSVKANMEKMLTLRNNANIVRFDNYTIIKESSCFYLVILMELLKPMSAVLKVDSLSQNEVIGLGRDICLALEGFREAGIIHREVKPENIYVDSEGNFKLGDFGVCRSRFGEDKVVSSYVAPELYTNGAVDLNSDIYSLGILLYKLLNNNRLPFLPSYPAPVSIEDRETAFAKRIRGDLFPAPSNATPSLANVIFKATSFRVQERYRSPEAFAEALEGNLIIPVPVPAPVFIPPVVPAAPVNPYHITDDTGIPLYEQSPVKHSNVTEDDKNVFNEVFSDDDDEQEITDEGEKVNKKWYFIIIALVVILAAVIAFVAKDSFIPKATTTTSAAPNITFGEQTEPPTTTTTTTQTTTATTTTQTTTSATTTTATTTTATTTTATTTTTTKPTTTQTTTKATTTKKPTTTATTTTATTTKPTTETTTKATTETTTSAAPVESTTQGYTEPVLVYSPNTEDGTDTRGRAYKKVTLSVEEGFAGGNEAVLVIEGLEGENAETDESIVTVCTMDNLRMVKRSPAVLFVESESDNFIKCRITADDESFSFEPEKYQYFICLEDGAVATDDTVNLGTQIRIEE